MDRPEERFSSNLCGFTVSYESHHGRAEQSFLNMRLWWSCPRTMGLAENSGSSVLVLVGRGEGRG